MTLPVSGSLFSASSNHGRGGNYEGTSQKFTSTEHKPKEARFVTTCQHIYLYTLFYDATPRLFRHTDRIGWKVVQTRSMGKVLPLYFHKSYPLQ